MGNLEKAKKSIEWYRAGSQVDEELSVVSKFVSNANSQPFSEKLREFRKPAVMRATVLIVALWTFMQICGFNSILFYMEIILREAKSFVVEPKVAVMYVSASAVVASVFSIVMIDRCGRYSYYVFF